MIVAKSITMEIRAAALEEEWEEESIPIKFSKCSLEVEWEEWEEWEDSAEWEEAEEVKDFSLGWVDLNINYGLHNIFIMKHK